MSKVLMYNKDSILELFFKCKTDNSFYPCVCMYATAPEWGKCNESCPHFNYESGLMLLTICHNKIFNNMENPKGGSNE